MNKQKLKDKVIESYYDLRYKFFNIPYAFKMRFIRKHHIIKTSLNPWAGHDTVEILLYGMMDSFKVFYEKEIIDGVVDWNSDTPHKKAKREMDDIYTWWCNYPTRLKQCDDALTEWADLSGPLRLKPYSGNAELKELVFPKKTKKCQIKWDLLNKLESDLEKETEKMLHKLVTIRQFLWT